MNDAEVAAGPAETPGYRYAEQVGDQLFVPGQVPQNRSGAIVAVGDPAGQAAVVDWFGGSVPPPTLIDVNRLGYPDQVVEVDAVIVRDRQGT